MAKEDKTPSFLDTLNQITEMQLSFIRTFEKRFDTLKEHRELVLKGIIPKSRKLRDEKTSTEKRAELKEEIQQVIAALGAKIYSNFNALLSDIKVMQTTSSSGGGTTTALEQVFVNEIEDARKAALDPQLNNTEIREKLASFTANLTKAVKKETEVADLDEYILRILRKLQELIEEQRIKLSRELDALEIYKFRAWNEETVQAIEHAEGVLFKSVKELDELLREEKREVMEPLSKVLKEKQDLNDQVGKLVSEKKGFFKKQNVITTKDLKADVLRLVRAEDVSRYLVAIAPLYRHFDKKAQSFYGKVSVLAAQAARGERIDLKKRAETAIIDGLTGVYNRRYFDEFLKKRLLEAQRYKVPFSMLILDIDNFKSFNSSYELTGGDSILQELASLLKNKIRASDYLFRYGGEEFAIIFTRTSPSDALETSKKLQGKLLEASETILARWNNARERQDWEEKEPWAIEKAEVERKFKIKHISFSGGLVTFSPQTIEEGFNPETAANTMNTRASKLVKRAKEAGRNQIIAE